MKLLVSGATTFNNCVIKAHRCFYLCSQSSESGDGQTRESQEGEDKSESNQKQYAHFVLLYKGLVYSSHIFLISNQLRPNFKSTVFS